MQCPTCGRGVRKDQEVCSSCGGFLGSAYLAEDKGEVVFAGQAESTPPRRPVFPSDETAEPELLEMEELEPAPAPPATPGAPPPARPKIPGLLRILFPLLFILFPLLNFLLRNSSFRSQPGETPVLQQALFCEGIQQSRPVNPREVFSLRRHRQVALYTQWNRSRGSHSYSFRWYTPEGNLQPSSTTVTRFQLGGEAFSTYAVLPLEAGMPLGKWRVEIHLDGGVQAQPSFELRE